MIRIHAGPERMVNGQLQRPVHPLVLKIGGIINEIG
jgi:hypothetical protein